MIRLPAPPRLFHLRAFGVVLSPPCAAIVAIVASTAFGANLLLTWIVVSAELIAASFVAPQRLVRLYVIWNAVVRRLSRAAALAVTGVCFLICAAVPKDESRFQSKPQSPGASSWVKTRPAHTALPQSSGPSGDRPDAGWVRTYGTWAPRSGNGWAVVLLPFLGLLSLFAEDEEEPVPVRNYTLF